jgi:hypothetical protein
MIGEKKLHGTYRRHKDGREITYWGKVWDYEWEIRTWPAGETPEDVLDLPITAEGTLMAMPNGKLALDLAVEAVEDWLEQQP